MSSPTKKVTLGRGTALLKRLREMREQQVGAQALEGATTLVGALSSCSLAETKSIHGARITSEGPAEATGMKVSRPLKSSPPSSPSKSTSTRKDAVVMKGEAGSVVKLSANYVEIRQKTGRALYEYSVQFEPAIDDLRSRYQKIAALAEVTGRAKMFNGALLILPLRLPQDTTTSQVEETLVTIVFKSEKSFTDPQSLMLCNHLMNQVFAALKLCPIKTGVEKCFYNPNDKTILNKHRLEIWPGYVFTVDDYEGGVYLQVDTSSKIVRTQTVLGLIMELAKKNPSTYRNEAIQELVGRSLITKYNSKTYKLDEIDFESSPSDIFDKGNGEKISFTSYYKERYNLIITDPKQPLLLHRPKRPESEKPLTISLIPELCHITGLSDAMRADFRVMKDVGEHTRLVPKSRVEVISKLLLSIRDNESAMDLFEKWGIELASNVLRTHGRRINPEILFFGGGCKESVGPKGDWCRAATTQKILHAIDVNDWTIVFPSTFENDAKQFCRTLRDQGPRLGIQIARPRIVPLLTDRTESYLTALKNLESETKLVVTLFGHSMRSDRYAAIKKFCCIERPIASQVVLNKTISIKKRLVSVCQKILLQINCKLGGELWMVKIPIEGLMVVGIDIFVDKAGGKGGRMLAGIVSSLNSSQTRFYSQVTFQEPGKDFKQSIVEALLICAQKYKEANNGFAPKHMVVYRDGVNSGQLEMAHQEACEIGTAFKSNTAFSNITVSVLVVQKRHYTRIFQFQLGSGTLDNPMAGTVLDHSITRRAWYDFYIVPMAITMGTVTPTHFTVVYDSSSFNPDQMQRLAYGMTFVYFNWPGNVKVPAQCQYAHKLVELVGEHLHQAHHTSLNDRLYYL